MGELDHGRSSIRKRICWKETVGWEQETKVTFEGTDGFFKGASPEKVWRGREGLKMNGRLSAPIGRWSPGIPL